MCTLFSSVYNFSRNFSIVINLIPLERYSKAQYLALVFVFKKWSKSEEKRRWKKSAFDTSMVWISFLHHLKAERSASSKIYTFMGKFCFLFTFEGKVLWTLHFSQFKIDFKNWGLHLNVKNKFVSFTTLLQTGHNTVNWMNGPCQILIFDEKWTLSE